MVICSVSVTVNSSLHNTYVHVLCMFSSTFIYLFFQLNYNQLCLALLLFILLYPSSLPSRYFRVNLHFHKNQDVLEVISWYIYMFAVIFATKLIELLKKESYKYLGFKCLVIQFSEDVTSISSNELWVTFSIVVVTSLLSNLFS